jgi:hypothetical protein
MADLLQDISRRKVFRSMVPEPDTSPPADSCTLEAIEWHKDLDTSTSFQITRYHCTERILDTTMNPSVVPGTVSQLACRRKVDLRIMLV